MTPAASNAQPAYSQAEALAKFQAQPPVENQFAQDIASRQPDIELMNVTDTQQPDGSAGPEEFLGWVITYQGVHPVFYGGYGSSHADPASMSCVLVGIENAETGQWVDTFESCS
jgi:hypothetical protein